MFCHFVCGQWILDNQSVGQQHERLALIAQLPHSIYRASVASRGKNLFIFIDLFKS